MTYPTVSKCPTEVLFYRLSGAKQVVVFYVYKRISIYIYIYSVYCPSVCWYQIGNLRLNVSRRGALLPTSVSGLLDLRCRVSRCKGAGRWPCFSRYTAVRCTRATSIRSIVHVPSTYGDLNSSSSRAFAKPKP